MCHVITAGIRDCCCPEHHQDHAVQSLASCYCLLHWSNVHTPNAKRCHCPRSLGSSSEVSSKEVTAEHTIHGQAGELSGEEAGGGDSHAAVAAAGPVSGVHGREDAELSAPGDAQLAACASHTCHIQGLQLQRKRHDCAQTQKGLAGQPGSQRLMQRLGGSLQGTIFHSILAGITTRLHVPCRCRIPT